MNPVTLPPSPNWYLSGVLACSKTNVIAWGSRNSIVIAKPEEDAEKSLNCSIIKEAHVEKVTTLAFCPEFGSPGKNFLVSGGNEYIVRVWNLDNNSAVSAFSFADTNSKVAAVDWSKKDPNLICCVTTEGSLMHWDIKFNTYKPFSLNKALTTCLACCPHDSNLVAVGSKSGLVYIVNLKGNGSIAYKLRGHNEEITCLSWCPVESNICHMTSSVSKDYLLASGGKDRSIFIWKAGSDGRCETEITLPTQPLDSQQHRSKLGASVGNWTALCWAEPNLLLTSSTWGELLSWDISTLSTSKKPVRRLIHSMHSRGLFCISNVPTTVPGDEVVAGANWRSRHTSVIWTLAQDRRLVCCKITENEIEVKYNIPTQGGYVYCMNACPLDTTQIAFGVGDAMIRLWNLSEPHRNNFDVTMLWQNVKGKVTAVCWHPEKENLLAFGTSEGRVGVFDTNGVKPPHLYRPYHRHTVYTIAWGPKPASKSVALYSCADGELVYYDAEKEKQAPKTVLKKGVTEFAWKPDYSCIAIGHQDGSIIFLNKNLEKYHRTLYTLKKAIYCLSWHPDSTAADEKLSPFKNYLAVAFNASFIEVYDISCNEIDREKKSNIKEEKPNEEHASPELEEKNAENEENASKNKHKLIATLTGHTDKVICLSWSPHESGFLISGSYDHTVQIWNVNNQEVVGTYLDHSEPVDCCMWSPLDPDLIITGSSDFTVRIWRLSSQKAILPAVKTTSKKVRSRKKKNKQEKIENSAKEITDNQEENNADLQIEGVPKESQNISNSSAGTENATNINEDQSNQIVREVKSAVTKDAKHKKPRRGHYFVQYSKSLTDKNFALQIINDMLETGSDDSSSKEQQVSLFSKKEDVVALIDHEKSFHSSQSQHYLSTEMDIWRDNFKENLYQALQEKRLNDFLVSLAPSLSMKTWHEMCEAYAAQLILEGNPEKAVSYLLCIHKIHRAVEVFLEAQLFFEAYALARCKLDPEDPMLERILRQWAKMNIRSGQFELAAQCYIKLGDYAEASRILGRRQESNILMVAAKLAARANDEVLSETLIEKAKSLNRSVSAGTPSDDLKKDLSLNANPDETERVDAPEATSIDAEKNGVAVEDSMKKSVYTEKHGINDDKLMKENDSIKTMEEKVEETLVSGTDSSLSNSILADMEKDRNSSQSLDESDQVEVNLDTSIDCKNENEVQKEETRSEIQSVFSNTPVSDVKETQMSLNEGIVDQSQAEFKLESETAPLDISEPSVKEIIELDKPQDNGNQSDSKFTDSPAT